MLIYTDSVRGTTFASQAAVWFWAYNASSSTHGIHLRHARKANIQRLDGSVKSQDLNTINKTYKYYYKSTATGGYAPHCVIGKK
jgi:prepilin-type processing-associated H-X9-DG protein